MTDIANVSPILHWELRTLARRRRYYFLRAAYVAWILLLLYLATGGNRRVAREASFEELARLAESVFQMVGNGQIFAIVLLTPVFVATSVVSERERRTLDFLLASDLSDFDIVVGKWAARSLNVVLLVLAGGPIFFLMVLLGGIDPQRIMYTAIVALATIASTAALAMRASIGGRKSRGAIGMAYFYLVLWLIFPFIAMMPYFLLLTIQNGDGRFPEAFPPDLTALLNPLVMTWECLGSVPAPGELGWRVAFYGAVHCLITLETLRRSIQQVRPIQVEYQSIAEANRQELEPQFRRRIPPVGRWPLFWKEWHFGIRWTPGNYLFATLGFVFWLTLSLGSLAGGHIVFGAIACMVALATVDVVTALMIARSVVSEKENDCWTSLLTTPLSGCEIVLQKTIGCLRPLSWLATLMGCFWFIAIGLDWMHPMSLPLLYVVIVCHTVFIAGLAINISLNCKSTTTASLWTMAAGFIFGGPLATMLHEVGLDSGAETLSELLGGTLPMILIWYLQRGVESDLQEAVQTWAYVWTALYAMAGAILLAAAIFRLDRYSGRSKQ